MRHFISHVCATCFIIASTIQRDIFAILLLCTHAQNHACRVHSLLWHCDSPAGPPICRDRGTHISDHVLKMIVKYKLFLRHMHGHWTLCHDLVWLATSTELRPLHDQSREPAPLWRGRPARLRCDSSGLSSCSWLLLNYTTAWYTCCRSVLKKTQTSIKAIK